MTQFEQYVRQGMTAYLAMMEPITPFFHAAYLIFLFRLSLYSSWVRSPFEWFVTANYAMFAFLPFGWIWVQIKKGSVFPFTRSTLEDLPVWAFGEGFGFSGTFMALMLLVTFHWYQEAKSPQNVYDFRGTPLVRWWVLPIMAWGIFYPFSPFQGPRHYDFLGWKSLWGSPFGILFAPTTTFLLGLLSLIFPKVNMRLFLALNAVGLLVFLHTFSFSPLDLPLGIVAFYNLGLFALYRLRRA